MHGARAGDKRCGMRRTCSSATSARICFVALPSRRADAPLFALAAASRAAASDVLLSAASRSPWRSPLAPTSTARSAKSASRVRPPGESAAGETSSDDVIAARRLVSALYSFEARRAARASSTAARDWRAAVSRSASSSATLRALTSKGGGCPGWKTAASQAETRPNCSRSTMLYVRSQQNAHTVSRIHFNFKLDSTNVVKFQKCNGPELSWPSTFLTTKSRVSPLPSPFPPPSLPPNLSLLPPLPLSLSSSVVLEQKKTMSTPAAAPAAAGTSAAPTVEPSIENADVVTKYKTAAGVVNEAIEKVHTVPGKHHLRRHPPRSADAPRRAIGAHRPRFPARITRFSPPSAPDLAKWARNLADFLVSPRLTSSPPPRFSLRPLPERLFSSCASLATRSSRLPSSRCTRRARRPRALPSPPASR